MKGTLWGLPVYCPGIRLTLHGDRRVEESTGPAFPLSLLLLHQPIPVLGGCLEPGGEAMI